MPNRYNDGEKVRINKPTLREHGVTGTVKSYDDATQWYWVELDKGPPWRGKYEHSELETPNCSSAQKLRSLPDVAALAKEFCRILSETLSAEQVAQVLMRNAEEANPSICHSHDFCDANMVMQAAFDSFGVDPMSSGENGKAMSDEIAVLWADAWDMAKGAGFNASDVARKTAARPS